MNSELRALVDALLRTIPVSLDTEENAIDLFMRTRWPEGRRCTHCRELCSRAGIKLSCVCGLHGTIFLDTPFETLRAPSVRGIFLALRAMTTDHRGIGARPLARLLNVPHVTLWRHIHLLRALLPPVPPASGETSDVLVCGRKTWALATVRVGSVGLTALDHTPPSRGVSRRRLVAESVRTWLNGTFHGVTADYLHLYVHEAMCRAMRSARYTVTFILAQLARA